MKAVFRTIYGDPDVLNINTIPDPIPKKDEIVIKVMATTINRTDVGGLTGQPKIYQLFTGWNTPKVPSTGTDFAGIVERIGDSVSRFKVGDRVFGFDDNMIGSHAEKVVVKEKTGMALIPDGIDFRNAAASIEGGHYAYNFINKVKMKAGQKVMLNGGTGAIGSAGIQLLHHLGMEIVATSRAEHIEIVKGLGATKVFDYQKEDFTQQDTQYDFVFDAVGKSSFGACKPILKDGGYYLSSELGPGNENLYLPFTTMFSSKKLIFPMPSNIQGSVDYIANLLEEGKYHPLIDEKSFSLDEIKQGFAYVMSEQKVGAVVIEN